MSQKVQKKKSKKTFIFKIVLLLVSNLVMVKTKIYSLQIKMIVTRFFKENFAKFGKNNL